MAEWANWSGRQKDSPVAILAPTSEAEIIDAVAMAAEGNLAIRAVGASHSHSRIAATNGLLLTLDGWQGIESVDTDNQTATFRSGSRIYQVGEPLREHGLALRNQGDIDRQSIAGATSTGTHGAGPSLQNLSASVVHARVVLASGDVIDCAASTTPELFEIVRHSLGAVGLLSTITVALRSAYRLHETLWAENPESVFGRIDQLVADTRHFEFFWMPQTDTCACKSLAETQDAVNAMPDVKLERVGWNHDIISSARNDLHTEMEYAVPAESGPACFNEVREMILQDFPDLQWPLEYRTVAADDLWISAATGRPTVTISAHQDISLDDRPLFEACEAIFRRYEGRPHWGKEHYQSGAELAQMYPKNRDWWRVRDEYDPNELFVTDYLARLRP
jgi:FAD/FMN-containing dehydrogenase